MTLLDLDLIKRQNEHREEFRTEIERGFALARRSDRDYANGEIAK
jgi:hypothetical protein